MEIKKELMTFSLTIYLHIVCPVSPHNVYFIKKCNPISRKPILG